MLGPRFSCKRWMLMLIELSFCHFKQRGLSYSWVLGFCWCAAFLLVGVFSRQDCVPKKRKHFLPGDGDNAFPPLLNNMHLDGTCKYLHQFGMIFTPQKQFRSSLTPCFFQAAGSFYTCTLCKTRRVIAGWYLERMINLIWRVHGANAHLLWYILNEN